MTLSQSARLHPAPQVLVREIEKGAVLVDVATGRVFELNQVALEVWRAVGQGRTLAEIHDILAARYPIARERLMADVTSLIEALMEAGLAKLAAT